MQKKIYNNIVLILISKHFHSDINSVLVEFHEIIYKYYQKLEISKFSRFGEKFIGICIKFCGLLAVHKTIRTARKSLPLSTNKHIFRDYMLTYFDLQKKNLHAKMFLRLLFIERSHTECEL